MKVWRDDLYGNEDAQGFLDEIEFFFEEDEPVGDLLERLSEHPDLKYPECQLVLADFELDFTGELRDSRDVLTLIDRELEFKALNSWVNPQERKSALLKFREKVENALFGRAEIACDNIWDWLDEKRG